MARAIQLDYKRRVDALFWLFKNFFWMLIGILLVRTPLHELATAEPAESSASQTRPSHKAWRTVRLVVGLYCIVISMWNLGSSILLHYWSR